MYNNNDWIQAEKEKRQMLIDEVERHYHEGDNAEYIAYALGRSLSEVEEILDVIMNREEKKKNEENKA
jgi:hypothetical protein